MEIKNSVKSMLQNRWKRMLEGFLAHFYNRVKKMCSENACGVFGET